MTQWEKCTYSMKCAQTYSCWQTTSLPSVKLPYIHFFVRWLYFRCICRWCTMHSCFGTRAQSAADGCCDGGFVSGLSNRRGTLHYVPACTLSFGAAHNIQCCTVALDAPRRHGHTYSMCNVHRVAIEFCASIQTLCTVAFTEGHWNNFTSQSLFLAWTLSNWVYKQNGWRDGMRECIEWVALFRRFFFSFFSLYS